jgi:3-phenylpropionate/cinnamic acid dioxygenase small subunit
MDDRLEALLAREQIVTTLTELFVRTDQRDWAAVRACFAERVLFDMTSLTGGEATTVTPRDITGGWKDNLRRIKAIHHQVGNFRVDLGDGEAAASCYGIAYHYRKSRSGHDARTFVGSYDFHLRRERTSWKIDLFRFNCKFITGQLDLEEDD